MNLSDLSTAGEMIEDIKMRFEMSRTFFDIEIDWRDFLVYLYYERYHSDDAEYIRGEENVKCLYRIHPINKNNVLEHFCGTYIRAQKDQLECYINDLFSLSISGDLVEGKYLIPFIILNILAENLNNVIHEIHRITNVKVLYILSECAIDNKNVEITKSILEYMVISAFSDCCQCVEALILYANKNENYEMQTVLMEFKNKYNLYQSDAERQKEWEL